MRKFVLILLALLLIALPVMAQEATETVEPTAVATEEVVDPVVDDPITVPVPAEFDLFHVILMIALLVVLVVWAYDKHSERRMIHESIVEIGRSVPQPVLDSIWGGITPMLDAMKTTVEATQAKWDDEIVKAFLKEIEALKKEIYKDSGEASS